MSASTKASRNIAAGLLTASSVTLWFTMFGVAEVWARGQPNATEQFVYRHKGLTCIGYLSAFQATSYSLMLIAPLLFMIGFYIAPKKNIRTRSGFLYWGFTFDSDDPAGVLRWGQIAGVLLTLTVIFSLGPVFVRWLNNAGIVFNIG